MYNACINIDSVMRMEKKLSIGLFRRMQIQNEKDKNDQIHRSWTRIGIRVRTWHWIRPKYEFESDTE